MDPTLIAIFIGIGLIAGTMSGVLGLGGGIFLVPLLLLAGLSQQSAQGTSLALLSLPVAAAAAYTYMRKDQVQLSILPSMSIGFIAGGLLGASLALYLPGHLLAKVFGVALILIGLRAILTKPQNHSTQKENKMTNDTKKAACKCGGKCDKSTQGCSCDSKKPSDSPEAPAGSAKSTAKEPANVADKKGGCGCDK